MTVIKLKLGVKPECASRSSGMGRDDDPVRNGATRRPKQNRKHQFGRNFGTALTYWCSSHTLVLVPRDCEWPDTAVDSRIPRSRSPQALGQHLLTCCVLHPIGISEALCVHWAGLRGHLMDQWSRPGPVVCAKLHLSCKSLTRAPDRPRAPKHANRIRMTFSTCGVTHSWIHRCFGAAAAIDDVPSPSTALGALQAVTA